MREEATCQNGRVAYLEDVELGAIAAVEDDVLHLVYLIEECARHLALEVNMKLHLHGLSLKLSISTHGFYIANCQTDLEESKDERAWSSGSGERDSVPTVTSKLTKRLVSKMGIRKMKTHRKAMLIHPKWRRLGLWLLV